MVDVRPVLIGLQPGHFVDLSAGLGGRFCAFGRKHKVDDFNYYSGSRGTFLRLLDDRSDYYDGHFLALGFLYPYYSLNSRFIGFLLDQRKVLGRHPTQQFVYCRQQESSKRNHRS